MWAKSLLLFCAVVALGAGTTPVSANVYAQAQLVQPNWVMPVQQQDRDIRPLREVVEILRGRYGGELISARLEDGARPVYVLRWRMPDGEVRDIRVDALR